MKILNKLKITGMCLGLCLAGSMFWSRAATAEITLIEHEGWTFSFDGRVNSFMSGGKGDNIPAPTTYTETNGDPGATHTVMQSKVATGGTPDFSGWAGAYGQQDKDGKYVGIRVRSGMFGNVLGFGLARQLSETTTIKAYVSLWSTVESLGRDKWAPIVAEAREGYFQTTGNWGELTVGRTLGFLGRTSYEIDVAYGHGYGVGLPCTDALGPACGHIGTGVLFPGYSAGISYSTPSVGGLRLHVGAYDPVTFSTTSDSWSRARFLRPEGAVTFGKAISERMKFKLGVEGSYQTLERTATDATTMVKTNVTTAIWGVSGGGRIEAGPVRLGVSGFRGRGTGLGFAMQRSAATTDDGVDYSSAGATPTYGLRTFTGYNVQGALVFGGLQIGGGFGQGIVDRLAVDKINPNVSVIHYQTGISAAAYYHLAENVVLGLDYFRFMAAWYGAPTVDPTTMAVNGQLAGEKQVLDFLNLGVTYRW